MKSDTLHWYDLHNIELSLLDQFDNDNIIELELCNQFGIKLNLLDQFNNNGIVKLEFQDKSSKYPSEWQIASNNDPKLSGFNEIGEVIEVSLGFQAKPW